MYVHQEYADFLPVGAIAGTVTAGLTLAGQKGKTKEAKALAEAERQKTLGLALSAGQSNKMGGNTILYAAGGLVLLVVIFVILKTRK